MSKRTFIVLLLGLLSLSSYAHDTLRIMTFNVAAGLRTDMYELGEYIKGVQADIVALQEVDLCTNRPETPLQNGRNQMVELGFYSDMLPVFGPIKNYPLGGYYGLGFLSKEPIYSIANVALPQVIDKNEPRSMMVATWKIFGKTITIANTHLSLDKSNRAMQMRYIRKYMRKIKGIKIICGDLNSDYSEELVTKVFKKWDDGLPYMCNTFPSGRAYTKYDWILYPHSCSIEVVNTVVDTTCVLSDHLPGYIDIVIK